MPGGERARAGARIGRIDGGIGEAVKGHGGGASGEHGNHDPDKLMSGGKSRGRQHGSTKSEGEREDRVLPLDHFQSDAEVVEDGHGTIVEQQFSVLTKRNTLFVACLGRFQGGHFHI